jgi:hypothetical protein
VDWALGRDSLPAQVAAIASKNLPLNREVRTVVNGEMRKYAAMLCNDDNPEEAAPLQYEGNITFHDWPMSDVFGTGVLSAQGRGTWTRDEKCSKSCRRVHVDAQWSYADRIDMHSWLESYRERQFSWDLYGPGVVITGACAAVEGAADLGWDKIQGASFDVNAQWSEQLDACCEDLEP